MKLKEYPASLARAIKINLALTRSHPNTKKHVDIIVSLTSIPHRLKTLHLTIGSVLTQTVAPRKIVLWLNNSLENKIPEKLQRLQSEIFEIRFRSLTSSHRKLVFSLVEFSDKTIVTCDDDVMYDPNWLAGLWHDHMLFPRDIIAQECREISYDASGKLMPYHKWPTSNQQNYSLPNLLPIGYGGVLYPPESLYADVTNQSLYMKLAPKADDLWFKAMSLLAGTEVRRCSAPCKKPIPIIGAKGNSLAKTNILQDGNRQQLQTIFNHYNISQSLVSN